MLKVGDYVRFDQDIPRPREWVEQTWRITKLASSWMPARGEIKLARIEARDGTVMEDVDTDVLKQV
jgi:hypothetical protein